MRHEIKKPNDKTNLKKKKNYKKKKKLNLKTIKIKKLYDNTKKKFRVTPLY